MVTAVLHGFVLALGLILPLGVQNTFVFTQGAVHRRLAAALPAVLTAAVCDTLLITLAIGAAALIEQTVPVVRPALTGIGVLFLLYMGWATWRTVPELANAGGQWPARRQVLFAASVSLLNPHAILDTVGVIGTNSLAYQGAPRLGFALACVAVSWGWFFALAAGGHFLGLAAGQSALRRWLNRVSALIMWGVALQLAYGVLFPNG